MEGKKKKSIFTGKEQKEVHSILYLLLKLLLSNSQVSLRLSLVSLRASLIFFSRSFLEDKEENIEWKNEAHKLVII